MNDVRRKLIEQARAFADKAQSIIESVRDDEQEAFNNLSESLQGGERGQQMEANIEALTSAYDALGEFDEYCDQVE